MPWGGCITGSKLCGLFVLRISLSTSKGGKKLNGLGDCLSSSFLLLLLCLKR
jgi:hypothetical protein